MTAYSGDIPYNVLSSANALYSISLHSALLQGYKVKITALDPGTGKVTSQNTLSSESEVTSKRSILYAGSNSGIALLVWTDKAFKKLKINLLGTKLVTSINVAQETGDLIEQVSVHAPQTSVAQAHFLVHYQTSESHWADVYHVDVSTGDAARAYGLSRKPGKGAFSTSTEGSTVYFTRNTDFEVTLMSSTSIDILGAWPVRPKGRSSLTDSEGILHAVSEVVSRGKGNFAVRSALTLPSGNWELIRNGDNVWIRPEGLAGVVAAAWVELPEEDDLAHELEVEGHNNVFAAYMHRVNRHAKDLKRFPEWVGRLPSRVMRSFLRSDIPLPDQGLLRDGFGFHKIVVLATDHGRLLALDVADQGKVLWNIKAVEMTVEQQWEVIEIEVADGVAMIRGHGGEFLRVQALTGKVLQYQPGGLIASLETSISILNASGKPFLLSVNVDGSLGSLPAGKVRHGTTVVTQGEDGSLRGWSIGAKDTRAGAVWVFIPEAGETIQSTKARPVHDPVASIGKALGDRSVLYKYLNRNLLLVTTFTPALSIATVYILDSISGEVLYTTIHSRIDTSRPIISTISENWIAYVLFSDPAALKEEDSSASHMLPKGYQLIVSELYESQRPNERGSLDSSSHFSSIYPTASENGGLMGAPYVVSQAYIIPGPISQMSATSTRQGITSRSLLCILPSLNALISIPRTAIDPRRPVDRDATAAEMEEGLFRYNAVLDFEPKWILSHNREVMGISHIISTPTHLESTSLVFCYGEIDIFGTRVAPIGGFDILGKGFNKLQLIGTVVALAIGTGVLAPMVSILMQDYVFIIC